MRQKSIVSAAINTDNTTASTTTTDNMLNLLAELAQKENRELVWSKTDHGRHEWH